MWNTTEGAPLALFGIPVASQEKTFLYIGIPKLLSLLIHFNPNAAVTGLNEFPPDERPPVFLPFISYHLMIIFGLYFILVALIAIALLSSEKVYTSRWFLKLLIYSLPLPYLSNEFGWFAAEIGRQPWVVYKVLRTSDAASVVVPPGQILFSLLAFALIYLLLGIVFIYLLLKIIRKGPKEAEAVGY